ncbi:MAG TPA: alpha-E domain-containing protein [Acetobacteraceae bacterium]|nr:alpha-E domain-containing protein [Acetobacteraceae bacterium]
MSGIALARGNSLLLSRYAESIFWLARYMERVENLARILDVTDTFMRHGADQTSWQSVVNINADEKRFKELHGTATAENVLHFYLTDRENPSSIISSLFAARENARTLRPLISTEMWTQINVFHNRVRQLTPGDARPSRVSQICVFLKEACQTHTGICEGTFFRDQAWVFYNIGKHLERGDQTSRLVDVKYHMLLPSPRDVGGAQDTSQWHALLRAASGYHAFRRVYPSGMTPGLVAGFLLLNHSFPRSVVTSVHQIELYLTQLGSGYGLRGAYAALERLPEIRAALLDQTIEQILARGLHEFLDWVQMQFIGLANAVTEAFWRPPAAAIQAQEQ